jgi:hypothetical protein
VNERRWFNPNQPQTLQIAVILLYIDAVLLLIRGAAGAPLFLVTMLGMGVGAFGIANEKKWGYALGVLGAALNLGLPFYYGVTLSSYLRYDPIGFIFSVALVALLLHPMSRDYQRIWFR